MKLYLTNILIIVFAALIIVSCNSNSESKKSADEIAQALDNANDTLTTSIMENHDAGMEIFKKLQVARSNVYAIIDSLNAKDNLNESQTSYKERLDSAGSKLTAALTSMSEWMDNIQMDSALYNPELRNKYLQQQSDLMKKINVNMKESLQFSDSIMMKK